MLVEIVGDSALGNRQPDLDHGLLELLAILRRRDGFGVGTDEFRGAGRTDETTFVESHGGVETGLTTERGQNRIGSLSFDDARHDFPCGSVMIVAGLELARITREPSSFRTRHAWVPE